MVAKSAVDAYYPFGLIFFGHVTYRKEENTNLSKISNIRKPLVFAQCDKAS